MSADHISEKIREIWNTELQMLYQVEIVSMNTPEGVANVIYAMHMMQQVK